MLPLPMLPLPILPLPMLPLPILPLPMLPLPMLPLVLQERVCSSHCEICQDLLPYKQLHTCSVQDIASLVLTGNRMG